MYACTAATADGARCRNWTEGKNRFCPSHTGKKRAKVAPKPDVVLYKFNINEGWMKKMRTLGVLVKEQDFAAKEQKHVQHAQAHGRDAFRYRKDVADSGVPVFGKEGLTSVSLYELLQELLELYDVVDVFIRPRRDGSRIMNVLVVSFSNGKEAVTNTNAFQELLSFLASSCWGYVHVWANPPQDDGRVVHTVNSSHREENKKAERKLSFANGLWAVAE